MKKLILFGMLCLTLPGCVGVIVPTTQTKIMNDPAICVYRDVPEEVRSRDSPEAAGRSYKTNCSSEWLRACWGKPDHISRDSVNSDEIWTYKNDLAWEGVVPFVVIPIPLVLPVTREKDRFSLRDGHVVSASVTKSCTVGGTYGFIPNPEGGGSFGAWNWYEDPFK